MYLRVLIGAHKGEVRNFAPAAARAMLSDGRAEHEFPPETALEPVAELTPGVVPEQTAEPDQRAAADASQPQLGPETLQAGDAQQPAEVPEPSPAPLHQRRRRR